MTFSSESVKKGLEKFKYMWDQGWFPESGLTGNRETMQQLFVQKELVQVMLQPNYLSYLTENVPEGVELASYAPLLENVNYNAWFPNLIRFNNRESMAIPTYYVWEKCLVTAAVKTWWRQRRKPGFCTVR